MSRELRTFQDALIARNVLARFVAADDEHEAMEFPTEDALAKYLKEHPRAKPNNHTVKRPKHDDAAAPAEKAEVEQASNGALHRIKFLESMLEGHHKKEDANYTLPLEKQWPNHAADLRKFVDKMIEGVNHIPAGKDRNRAKEIAKKLDEAWEEPNKELGFRWNRPDRAAYLPAEHLEKMLKTTKPLVEELDKLFQGQRMLMSRVLARHIVAQHESMEFATPEAMQKYLKEHPKADKSKHTVKDPSGAAPKQEKKAMPEGLVSATAEEAHHAKTRSVEITKLHEAMRGLQDKAEDANPTAQKQFDRAYAKIYDLGDTSSKAAKKLLEKVSQYENHIDEGSQVGDAVRLLNDALGAWDRNRIDHFRVKGEFGYRFRGMQAEQTWAYGKEIDDKIDMLDRAMKGEYD